MPHSAMAKAGATRLRYALVFLAVALLLAWISGPNLIRPSSNNHHVHMASGWFEGRWDLESEPPGYKRRAHDDWARLWTLTLADGESVRAFPCQTRSCDAAQREDGKTRWWILPAGLGRPELRAIPRTGITRRAVRWFVSFPPGPAAVLSPFVAVMGLKTPDTLLTVLLAALAAAICLWMLDSVLGRTTGHIWLAVAFSCGSPLVQLGSQGNVWFTAQVCAAVFSLLSLEAASNSRRPAIAGLCIGLATACRPHLMLLVGFALHQILASKDVKRNLAAFALPLVAVLTALAIYNAARFGDPTEFGHRYLDMRWQVRVQEIGMFSVQYVSRNLQCLLSLMPQVDAATGQVRVSTHGVALWLTTPWLVLGFLGLSRRPSASALALLCTALALALPSLCYHNSGQVQFSYRFALDWIPVLVLAMAWMRRDMVGAETEHDASRVLGQGRPTTAAPARGATPAVASAVGREARVLPLALRVAIVVAVVVHVTAAAFCVRAPARLFVVDPAGWPFESELKDEDRR